MTIREIADECGVSGATIHKYMDEFGIERRQSHPSRRSSNPASFTHHPDGYELWIADQKSVPVHQLVAVAHGADPYVVSGGGAVVHHENGIPWDYRDENLAVYDSHSVHMRDHSRAEIAEDQSLLTGL